MHRAGGPDPLLSGLQQTGDGRGPRTAPRHRQVQEGQGQLARHLHVLQVDTQKKMTAIVCTVHLRHK